MTTLRVSRDMWRTAALLKMRTRRAIAERVAVGDPPVMIAAEYRVPLEWVEKVSNPGYDVLGGGDEAQDA